MSKSDIDISTEAIAMHAALLRDDPHVNSSDSTTDLLEALAADRDRLARTDELAQLAIIEAERERDRFAKERDDAIILKDSALDSGAELLAKVQIAVRRMDAEHNFLHPGEIVYLAEKLVLERDHFADRNAVAKECLSAAIARAEKAEAERDDMRAELKSLCDPTLKDMRLENGQLDLSLSGPAVERIAAVMAGHFRSLPAQNYIEMSLMEREPPNDRFVVSVQRMQGKSPHELRREAEAERDAAKRDLAEANRLLIVADKAVAATLDDWTPPDPGRGGCLR